jgi:hypothetical protein
MTQFIYIPFGGSGGGGSSQDRFAPKYVVGNTANGDTATAYSTGGFYYIPDSGDGTGIATALAYATLGDPDFVALGDVWIRPGTYTVSQTLVVPAACTVRGSGTPTFIRSVAGAIAGPLFSLNHNSSLRQMSLEHSEPAISNTQYGVVDLRGSAQINTRALCEDVEVLTSWGNPTNATIYGGFVSYNVGNSTETLLRCVRCAVRYGLNDGLFNYTANLAGYRLVDASLELFDCTGQYLAASTARNGSFYVVVGDNAGTGSLIVRGGVFTGYTGGIFLNGVSATRMLVDGAKITASDPNNASTSLGTYRSVNAVVTNNTITETSGAGGSQAIVFDAQGVAATTNCGQVTGNRIAVSGGTKPWNSIDGYHVFVANTYTGATAPVSAVNDEVAHNINI